MSINPGAITNPLASTILAVSAFLSCPIALILSPIIPKSASYLSRPVPSIIVPFFIRVSNILKSP